MTSPYTREWAEDNFPGGRWQPNGEYLVSIRDEKTPSCFINLEKRSYCDFGDNRGKLSDLLRELNIPDPYKHAEGQGPDYAAILRNGTRKQDTAKDGKTLEAQHLWNGADPATEHPYLTKKQIPGDGLKVSSGVLLIPALDVDGQVVGVERISADGSKRHLGKKSGAFHPCGDLQGGGPILIAEGTATACSLRELSGWATVCAFGSQNLLEVGELLRDRYRGREICVAPDHDTAGHKAGADCRKAGFKVVELPQGSKDKADWNDVANEQGLEQGKEIFRDCWQKAQEYREEGGAKGPGRGFKLQRIGDIELVEPEYLVDGLVEADTLAMFFGETESYKSFCAIDLAACIATGAPWAGRQVKEGAVVYMAGEGHGGLARRGRAWELQRGISLADAPLFVSSKPGLFLDERSALEVEGEVDRVAAEYGAPLLIVVDTVARAMSGGDENSAKDTGLFVERVDALRRRYGATVLLVHHSGLQDKGRGRGSSALKAALDAEYQVERADNTAIITATKTKDGPRPAPLYFEAVEHVVMENKYGDEITSLAMELTDDKPAARERKLPPNARLALDAYHEAAQMHPVVDERGNFIGVRLDDWGAVFNSKSTAGTRQGKWAAFSNARKTLVTQGRLTVKDDIYAPVEPGDCILTSEYAKRLNQVVGRQQASTSVNKLTSVDAQAGVSCQHPSTTPYRVLTLLTPVVDGGDEKEPSEEKAPAGIPPRGQKTLGANDVSFPAALRWLKEERPDLLKAIERRAQERGGDMIEPDKLFEAGVKIEYAKHLEAGRGDTRADTPSLAGEATYEEALAWAKTQAGLTEELEARSLEVGKGGLLPEMIFKSAVKANYSAHLAEQNRPDEPPGGASIRELAERAGVDAEAVLEELKSWQACGRLEVMGDTVRIIEGAGGYPGMDEDGEADAPDTEPPGGSSPDGQGGLFGGGAPGPLSEQARRFLAGQ